MRKIIYWILGSLFVIFLIFIFILPTLISTSWGTREAVALFNSYSSGKLSAEKLELSWFGKQHVENLIYENENKEKILGLPFFETNTSLFYLLFGGRKFGSTTMREPYLVIEQEEEKEKPPKEKKKKSLYQTADQWPQFSGTLTVINGTVILKKPQMSPITISEINVEKQLTPPLYHIQANTLQGDVKGKIDIEFALNDQTKIKGEVIHFPVAILDQLFDSPLYSETIGKTLDINFHLTKESDKTIALSAVAKAKNIDGTFSGEIKDKMLYLDPSSRLNFTVTSKLFQFLLPESQKNVWTLASPTTLSFEITKGVFPLSFQKQSYKNIDLQAKGEIQRAEIAHKSLGSYSLNNFKVDIVALNELEITYEGEIAGKESSVISGSLSLNSKGNIAFKTNYKGFPVSLISLISPPLEKTTRRLFGSVFDLKAEGTYKEKRVDSQFELKAPNLEMNGTVKGVFESLRFDVKGNKTIIGRQAAYIGKTVAFELDGIANLSQEKASIPLLNGTITTPYYSIGLKGKIGERAQQLDYHEAELIATGEVLKLPFNEEIPHVSLRNGSFFINFDGPSNKIFGQAYVNTRVETSKGTIGAKTMQARFDITDFIHEDSIDFKKANITFNCDFEGLPTVVLNPFMPEKFDLSTLVGPSINIQAKGNYTPTEEPSGSLELKAKGEGLDIDLAVAIDQTLSITKNRPSFIHWELTPARYHALATFLRSDYHPLFQLTKPVPVDLTITEFTCPTNIDKGKISHFLCQSGFVGDLKIGTIAFRSRTSREYLIIEGAKGFIKGVNFSEVIELYLGGSIFAQNVPRTEKSAFEFKGSLLNFWTPEGKFNREGLTLDGELNLELIPVRQITEIYPLDDETRQLLQAVLGELMNARIYGTISQMTGPLTIDVKASNFKATLPILLNPHAIYLRDAVNAEITLTEAVNHTLIADINPLLITGAFSDHPIRVYIDPQGFMIPIRPYSLRGVQIGQAIIDIGKIRVRNGGQIQLLMNFLKAQDITPEGEMDAWFTPIYMNLRDGVATYRRFDALLANQVHIALWGSVNLITSQVRMTLGIAGSTIQQRFHISGFSKKEMFQVKMRGTTDHLELDWSAASTRIGVLIAKTATGGIGAIVGSLLEQIIPLFGEERAPPPTTQPFPWQK